MRNLIIAITMTLSLCSSSFTLAGCGSVEMPTEPEEIYTAEAITVFECIEAVPEESEEPVEEPNEAYLTDYLAVMMDCCICGDTENGTLAEMARNEKIATLGMSETAVSFEDLLLLSKLISTEAGSSWLSVEWRIMVGEVLLNRVASPEFPDTLRECVYQTGQYSLAGTSYFESLLPDALSVEAAARLLSGERLINDTSVVFQSNSAQGSGVCITLHDSVLGNTYLCYSYHPELYAED